MIQNALFHQCLAAIPEEHKAEFELSFSIAERISEILKDKGLTQKEFASLLGKRESEVSKWLTGRHNFTIQTIARIEYVLGRKVIKTTDDDVVCYLKTTDGES
jgi:transcriptional regulator with XRE-family HTH domain